MIDPSGEDGKKAQIARKAPPGPAGGFPMSLLEKINSPADLKKLKPEELPALSEELRQFLIHTVADSGGHFASNLGVVELTVALHYVFDSPTDKIMWDVGHQIYPHKILTGRRDVLRTVRTRDGISGFPKREESPHDHYNTGHAGTSISQMLGEVAARDLQGKDHHCVAVIGDASIAAGMALEALNHGGFMKRRSIVLLNDNDMSISRNVGALNKYLTHIIATNTYNKGKRWFYNFLRWLPFVGLASTRLVKKTKNSLKHALFPGHLFEDMGFRYFGPINGHDVLEMVDMLTQLRDLDEPVILHAVTQKGKGYHHAEKDPIAYHGVKPFNPREGMDLTGTKSGGPPQSVSYSALVGEVLSQIARSDSGDNKLVITTPAMIEGSGLKKFGQRFPDRLFDVGIAEQHATTFAAAMASAGMNSFLAIYSTFLQRGFDQLVHDVALMDIPLKLVIDRAGAVGQDGETHQGMVDLAMLLQSPGVRVLAPRDGRLLVDSLFTAAREKKHPIAVRYPKSTVKLKDLPLVTKESGGDWVQPRPLEYVAGPPGLEFRARELRPGRGELIQAGGRVGCVALGPMVAGAREVSRRLSQSGALPEGLAIWDPIWLRPLDIQGLESFIGGLDSFYIMEDASRSGGATGYLLQELSAAAREKFARAFHFPDEPVLHGSREEQMEMYGISPAQISEQINRDLGQMSSPRVS